jgi:hypothetical protein
MNFIRDFHHGSQFPISLSQARQTFDNPVLIESLTHTRLILTDHPER